MNGRRRVIVLGLGASGEAAARLLASTGGSVRVLDSSAEQAVEERKKRLERLGIEVCIGVSELAEGDLKFADDYADLCVVSPGIRTDSPWIRFIDEAGIPVCPELDLGAAHAKAPVIAVTGSNGKSTLVKLLADTLGLLGMTAIPCGNYGMPLSEAVVQEDIDRLIVEVSTFQLERSTAFTPQSAVLLNVHPNHLDRHSDLSSYAELKAKLFAHLGGDAVAVVNEENLDLVKSVNSEIEPVTIGEGKSAEYYYDAGHIHGRKGSIDVRGTFLDNCVMGLTGAAALAVVTENGWDPKAIERASQKFVPLHFRMEELSERDGVRFVNNSKATTLASIEASLKMLDGSIRLISGGVLKEENLGWIKKMLVKKVTKAYLYGQAGGRLKEAWNGLLPCDGFLDLSQAVKAAWDDAKQGDIILLSPGCASFDQYSGYAERGREFDRIVKELRR